MRQAKESVPLSAREYTGEPSLKIENHARRVYYGTGAI